MEKNKALSYVINDLFHCSHDGRQQSEHISHSYFGLEHLRGQ